MEHFLLAWAVLLPLKYRLEVLVLRSGFIVHKPIELAFDGVEFFEQQFLVIVNLGNL